MSRNPVTAVSSIEDVALKSPTKSITAQSHFDLYFTLHDGNQRIRMALEPNPDVLAHDAHVTHLDSSGEIRTVQPVDRLKHRVYRGSAYILASSNEWVNAGWARIALRRDGANPIFEGAFRLHGDHHHIHTVSNYRKVKHAEDPSPVPPNDASGSSGEYMVVWRDSDIMEYWQPHDELRKRSDFGRVACGSDDLSFNHNFRRDQGMTLAGQSTPSLFGRQSDEVPGNNGAGINLVDYIGSTSGCPDTRKVALLGVAADCNYRQGFDSDEDAQDNIVQQINSASAVYENTFNISLGLQNLTILAEDCPASAPNGAPWNVGCNDDVSITDRLSLFSEWRGRSEDDNAFWTLLTTCQTESAVGLAWLGQVCTQGSRKNEGDGSDEVISSANVVVRTQTEWQVIAHEIGHTFGAVHDCTSGTCREGDDETQRCCPLDADTCDADAQFLMNPSTGRGIDSFSPCSIGNICASVKRTAEKCLVDNRDVKSFTGGQCGNGIVETDEDCDCGGEEGCDDNPCCDAKTCKFTTDSVCDPANEDCCTNSCQFANAGTVCRASTGLCDPEEKCSGDSSLCPKDKHQDDGSDCGEDGKGLTCASGQCTSRDQQCRAMVGGSNSSDVTSCDYSQACYVACRWPGLPDNQCNVMNSFFLDGTPCPGGGKCEDGECKGGDFGSEVEEFFNENKNIIIPVASVVGAIVGLALLWCLFGAVRRRMAARKAREAAKTPAASGPHNWAAYGGQFAPRGEGLGLTGATEAPRRTPQAMGPPPPYPNYQGGPPPPPPARRSSMRYA